MHNGVYLMAGAAAVVLLYTGGDLATLVVMYSINVFLTFSLSNLAMMRHWWQVRGREPWKRAMSIHALGFLVCMGILAVTVIEKFAAGGWVTLVITGAVVSLCLWVKGHYRQVGHKLAKLSEDLSFETIPAVAPEPPELDPAKSTAIVLAVASADSGSIPCSRSLGRSPTSSSRSCSCRFRSSTRGRSRASVKSRH